MIRGRAAVAKACGAEGKTSAGHHSKIPCSLLVIAVAIGQPLRLFASDVDFAAKMVVIVLEWDLLYGGIVARDQ